VLFGVPRRFRCGECSKPWQLSYSAWLSDKVAKLANQINDFQGLSNFNIFQYISMTFLEQAAWPWFSFFLS
jgi:hypothetical protein